MCYAGGRGGEAGEVVGGTLARPPLMTTMRTSFNLVFGAWALLTACGSGAPEEKKQVPVTAGGCACPDPAARSDGTLPVAALSLDCYCAEFPNRCPDYEQAKAGLLAPASPSEDVCADSLGYTVTEQQGCGKIVISVGGAFGGHTLVYDEQTHALVGAKMYGDAEYGACNRHGYVAGESASCQDGRVCFLCESPDACEQMCSTELLTKYGGVRAYEPSSRALQECGDDSSPRPELHVGCGVVRVVGSSGSQTYALGTHELRHATFAVDAQCPDGWGEATAACADETVCSLCRDDPHVCTPEQLRAE